MSHTDLQTDPAARRSRRFGDSAVTPADFKNRPEELFGAHHLIAARVVNSRSSLRRAVQAKKIPAPLRLPNGMLAWYGRTLSGYLESLEQAAAAEAA